MAIRILMLDDDNHSPSYHAENMASWHDANDFIKYLTRPHTVIIPYEVRKVALIDIDLSEIDSDIDIDHFFDIVDFNGRGYSFEEYQEAFDLLWKCSEDI